MHNVRPYVYSRPWMNELLTEEFHIDNRQVKEVLL